ncbi:unnamed protein product [Closterium sp. Naga37s-1]|nr:unnamed protein product [Closterium sp. Naga37s-1]
MPPIHTPHSAPWLPPLLPPAHTPRCTHCCRLLTVPATPIAASIAAAYLSSLLRPMLPPAHPPVPATPSAASIAAAYSQSLLHLLLLPLPPPTHPPCYAQCCRLLTLPVAPNFATFRALPTALHHCHLLTLPAATNSADYSLPTGPIAPSIASGCSHSPLRPLPLSPSQSLLHLLLLPLPPPTHPPCCAQCCRLLTLPVAPNFATFSHSPMLSITAICSHYLLRPILLTTRSLLDPLLLPLLLAAHTPRCAHCRCLLTVPATPSAASIAAAYSQSLLHLLLLPLPPPTHPPCCTQCCRLLTLPVAPNFATFRALPTALHQCHLLTLPAATNSADYSLPTGPIAPSIASGCSHSPLRPLPLSPSQSLLHLLLLPLPPPTHPPCCAQCCRLLTLPVAPNFATLSHSPMLSITAICSHSPLRPILLTTRSLLDPLLLPLLLAAHTPRCAHCRCLLTVPATPLAAPIAAAYSPSLLRPLLSPTHPPGTAYFCHLGTLPNALHRCCLLTLPAAPIVVDYTHPMLHPLLPPFHTPRCTHCCRLFTLPAAPIAASCSH